MIDYSLGENNAGPVTLEIKDSKGEVVRRYASTDPVPPEDPKLKIPRYWVRPPRVLVGQAGNAPLFLGHARRTVAGDRAGISDDRGVSRDRAATNRAMGPTR